MEKRKPDPHLVHAFAYSCTHVHHPSKPTHLREKKCKQEIRKEKKEERNAEP
jgi:hypothetical protein